MSRYRVENVPGYPAKGWHWGSAEEAHAGLVAVFGGFGGIDAKGNGTGGLEGLSKQTLSGINSGKYGNPNFIRQSIMSGMPLNIDGKAWMSKQNVFGMPVFTSDAKGRSKTYYPTDNLTGYAVHTTDKNVINSLKKNPYIRMSQNGGVTTIYPSGNITGWPVIYNVNGLGGPQTKFVMPGIFQPGKLGHLEWDKNGLPKYTQTSDLYLNFSDNKNAWLSTSKGLPAQALPNSDDKEELANQLNMNRKRSNASFSLTDMFKNTSLFGEK
jgi:hypothetical protein